MKITNLHIQDERPIFIVGSKRGGTTLLRRIVNAHSMVSIPPPEWFYHFIYPHLYSYGDLNQEINILQLIKDCLEIPVVKKYWNIEKTTNDIFHMLPEKSFRGVIATLFRLYAQKYDSPIWGSKTPSDVFWLKEIQDDFPDARFLFIYRDGRDVSIDLVNIHWGPTNLYTACLLWRSYVQAMLQSKKSLCQNSYYEIYYEELVQEPEKATKKVCDFLELEYESNMLRYYEKETDNFMKHSYHQKTNKPITTEYMMMYKNLPLLDRQLQAEVIGKTLRQLGYIVEEEPRKIGFWEQERYLEEDRHGGLILEGAVEFKHLLKKKRLERCEKGIWNTNDKLKFLQKIERITAEKAISHFE